LAWVRPIRAATAFSVTAATPSRLSRSRAAATAAARLSSGGNRLRICKLIDIYVSNTDFVMTKGVE
jgi:hypothetical protein